MRIVANFKELLSHFSHRTLIASLTCSSHPVPSLQSSCRMSLAKRRNGIRNPSGSNTVDVVRRIPLFVTSSSLNCGLKVNSSFPASHRIPSARCKFSSVSMLLVVDVETSSSGNTSRTAGWLLANLHRRKPQRFSISTSCFTRVMATASDSTDFRRSST